MSFSIKRFTEDLQLAGYAKRSRQAYVSSVLRLQRFYNKPLEDITEEGLGQYWLCYHSECGCNSASLGISYSGIQHFFTRTCVRSWNIFREIKWRRDQKLPLLLVSLNIFRRSILPYHNMVQGAWIIYSSVAGMREEYQRTYTCQVIVSCTDPLPDLKRGHGFP